MKSLIVKSFLAKQKLLSSFERFIKDERGDDGGVLPGIIWVAIILLAVISLATVINAIFTASGTSFQTWVAQKLALVFK